MDWSQVATKYVVAKDNVWASASQKTLACITGVIERSELFVVSHTKSETGALRTRVALCACILHFIYLSQNRMHFKL